MTPVPAPVPHRASESDDRKSSDSKADDAKQTEPSARAGKPDDSPSDLGGSPPRPTSEEAAARPKVPRPATEPTAARLNNDPARRRPVVFDEDDDLDVPDFLK
jgi:cell division protein FtsZ